MRKTPILLVAATATTLLAGCGHNAITYGDGVGFDFGVNPENFTMSMNLRYGLHIARTVSAAGWRSKALRLPEARESSIL
jgi:hypothetical protein